MNYKHQTTGDIISESCYNKLPLTKRIDYSAYYSGSVTHEVKEDDSGDFLTSVAIGYATDSALLGGLIGGDFAGGIIGDLLND